MTKEVHFIPGMGERFIDSPKHQANAGIHSISYWADAELSIQGGKVASVWSWLLLSSASIQNVPSFPDMLSWHALGQLKLFSFRHGLLPYGQ